MKNPPISIIIATYNSSRTLEKTLESIKNQTYPKNMINIIVVDGGSTDNTKAIAREYGCKIIKNPKIDPVSAKQIGFVESSGKYILFLDSDEVLESPTSLATKVLAFKKNKNVKSVIPNGYKTPSTGSAINYYINEFGDPFSYFFYNESKNSDFFIKNWLRKYKVVDENRDYITFDLSNVSRNIPLLELSAGGCMIDLKYTKKTFPHIESNTVPITHIFYLLNSAGTYFTITKNDSTIHYSSDTLSKYLKKLSSRIKNNIFSSGAGWVGFRGREKFQPYQSNIKKYLFIPYSLSLILPGIDSLYLCLSRKQAIYLLHLPLCLYTSIMIMYFLILKILGVKLDIRIYGK